MATQIITRVSSAQDQVIELIESVKDPLTQAVETIVDFVIDRVDIPAVPFAEEIPTPKEIIDNQSKFASKLVTTNKSVALSAAKAASPATDKLLDRTTTASRRATAKAAA